ncbi:hypothetical protein [Kocuria marina]|uniref:hypothetical protein n=1 Tax=Kocuria marina TaxID=223184 RepID=UPI003F2114F1
MDKKSYPDEVPVRLCNYTDVYYQDVITSDLAFMEATASAEQISRFSVQAGDVPITKDSETSDDIGRPSYVPKDLPGVVYGYHLAIYRSFDPHYSKFIRYLFDSSLVRAELETRTPGVTRVGLSQDTLRNLRVPTPPPPVAAKIADYLDHETAEIDGFISEQLRLSRLLGERRNNVIYTTVTKGTRPQARYIESRNPAIGEYPSHWTLIKIKHIGDLLIGMTYSPEDVVGPEEDGSLVVRAGNIQQDQLVAGDSVYISKTVPARLRLRENDIIICARNGSAKLIGKNALVTPEFLGHTWGAFMVVLRSQYAEFLSWFLKSEVFATQTGSFATTTINQLTSTDLGNMVVALPPKNEQTEINRVLHAQTSRIDGMLSDSKRLVDLARERRAALITAAVTGQIDVTAKHKPAAEQIEDDVAQGLHREYA